MDGWREKRVGGGEDEAGRGEVTLGLNSAVEIPRPQQTRQKKKTEERVGNKGCARLGPFFFVLYLCGRAGGMGGNGSE